MQRQLAQDFADSAEPGAAGEQLRVATGGAAVAVGKASVAAGANAAKEGWSVRDVFSHWDNLNPPKGAGDGTPLPACTPDFPHAQGCMVV